MRKLYYAIIVLLLVGLNSCREDDEPKNKSILGSWEKTFTHDNSTINMKMIFRENGEVEYSGTQDNNVKPSLNGIYKMISDDEIELQDEECTHDDSENNIIGRYRVIVKANTLELILIDDECVRSEILGGIFNRI